MRTRALLLSIQILWTFLNKEENIGQTFLITILSTVMISPTPLLVIIASNDTVTPTKGQQAALELAKEPRRLIIVQGGHFDADQGTGLQKFAQAAVDWFKQYLNSK